MQKNQKVFLIIVGTILLVSVIVTGTSASPMAAGSDISASQPFSAQFSSGSADVSCTACHGTKTSLEEWAQASAHIYPTYSSLYHHILYTHTASHIDNSTDKLDLSQEAIYTILTRQNTEQTIRLESSSDPIVQCSYCHTGEAEREYLLNIETN